MKTLKMVLICTATLCSTLAKTFLTVTLEESNQNKAAQRHIWKGHMNARISMTQQMKYHSLGSHGGSSGGGNGGEAAAAAGGSGGIQNGGGGRGGSGSMDANNGGTSVIPVYSAGNAAANNHSNSHHHNAGNSNWSCGRHRTVYNIILASTIVVQMLWI